MTFFRHGGLDMGRFFLVIGGVGASVGMVLGGLWCWQHAADVVMGCSQPGIAAWGVRIGGVALVAAAQMLAMLMVVARIFRRDATTRALTWGATAVWMLASVSAVALGLAGR
jgi:hypothetical protein